MKTEQITLSVADGMDLPGILWLPAGEVKAVLQITHGMTEHIGRYEKLAELLTEHGIAVCGTDLRGHGRNPGDPACASFGESGWNAALDDMHRLAGMLAGRFPTLPHFHLGFSLGSFLLREYLSRYDDPVSGAVILGTGQQPGIILSVIMALVHTQIRKNGFDKTTPFVRQLSFGTYNQKFRPNRTASDWLCADRDQLDGYLADPLCRRDISAGLFYQLLDSMRRTGSASAYDNWNRQTPVLLLSGGDDPVGDGGKGVTLVYHAMEKAGIAVSMELYPGARHDLLHEYAGGCADKALERITGWILEHISA